MGQKPQGWRVQKVLSRNEVSINLWKIKKTKEAHVQSEETFSSGNRNFRSESRKISAHKKFRNNTDCSVTLLFPRWSVRQPWNFSLNPFLILTYFRFILSWVLLVGVGSPRSESWVFATFILGLGHLHSQTQNSQLHRTIGRNPAFRRQEQDTMKKDLSQNVKQHWSLKIWLGVFFKW